MVHFGTNLCFHVEGINTEVGGGLRTEVGELSPWHSFTLPLLVCWCRYLHLMSTEWAVTSITDLSTTACSQWYIVFSS